MKLKTLKDITDKLRPFKKYEPPKCNNPNLPPVYNIILSAAVKNGGKTYNCVQLLTNYENAGFTAPNGNKVLPRIIWVAGGTARSDNNSILNSLKYLHDEDRIDVEENVNEKMAEIYADLKNERDQIVAYNIYREVYSKFMNKKLNLLEDNELMLLKHKNYIDPKDDPDKPVDRDGNELLEPRIVFLIIDDLISNKEVFSTGRANWFNKIAVKSRHSSPDLVPINLYFITQSFKAVSVIIRKQVDLFILMRSANRKYILETISDEVGSTFTREELEEYYDKIMAIDHGSLILSVHKAELPENRVRMGWNKSITRDPKYIF
tara:strand:+ start:612 stop:1571 length:960 start_codon:yes stop_codon:yes gene_type:complete